MYNHIKQTQHVDKMSIFGNKNTTLSLRINNNLKIKLREISQFENKSLNDLSTIIFTDFVNDYAIQQVKDDEIPTAEQAKEMIKSQREAIYQSSINLVKLKIKTMIEDADDYTVIRKKELQLPFQQIQIELQNLGYHVYVVQHHIVIGDVTLGEQSYYQGDVLISPKQDVISEFKEFDEP